ncbi:MAG: succinate dehydrogenase, hydrophobic membrane anchor protein [Caulobacterales bacterium 68-7]|nr:succinate dehydrogenase, hydrophobic membrane anchor protein [Caulobacterales bacterium]OJU14093.1 MAG: succinate dehydrogenase, hydrophobic membrane anchor protein [Caulobacterales bacterium 68-7]
MARSPEARVKAQGSAKHGASHFIAERVTSIALVPLSLWAVYAVIALAPLPYEGVVAWLQSPLNIVFSTLFIAIAFYHMGIGMKVVIEDYIHKPSSLVLLLLLNTLAWGLGAVVAIVCILKVAFTGAVA